MASVHDSMGCEVQQAKTGEPICEHVGTTRIEIQCNLHSLRIFGTKNTRDCVSLVAGSGQSGNVLRSSDVADGSVQTGGSILIAFSCSPTARWHAPVLFITNRIGKNRRRRSWWSPLASHFSQNPKQRC